MKKNFSSLKKKKKIHTDLQAEQEHRAECWDGLQHEDYLRQKMFHDQTESLPEYPQLVERGWPWWEFAEPRGRSESDSGREHARPHNPRRVSRACSKLQAVLGGNDDSSVEDLIFWTELRVEFGTGIRDKSSCGTLFGFHEGHYG